MVNRRHSKTNDIRRSKKKAVSIATFLNLCTVDATWTRLQHRVRKAHRRVPYEHVVEGRTRDSGYPRFWLPEELRVGSTDASSVLCRESSCRVSKASPSNGSFVVQDSFIGDNEMMWMFLADAARQSAPENPFHIRPGKRRRLAESHSSLNSFRLRLRRLYDQFVGQDCPPKADNVSVSLEEESFQWNVSTEIEFDINSTFTGIKDYNETSSVVYTTSGEVSNASKFQPLRIRAILTESSGYGASLTSEERNSLFHDILSPALLTWSSSLRVDPVVGNLTVDVHQLPDGQSCGPGIDSGLPSIKVPLEHLRRGIPDTDMIVYLSLGFVETTRESKNGFTGNSTNSSMSSNVSDTAAITASFAMANRRDGSMTDESLLNVTNSDKVISNGNFTRLPNGCGGKYLAAASFCSTDQYDRPTAALLHICIDEPFFELSSLNRNILTLKHELGHALGFNSLSMAHFRRPDGTPITARVDDDIPDSEVECTGPSSERRSARVPLPSEEILQFRTVRGGVRVAQLVTPSVLQVVRNQFDCQRLLGAELESGESLPLSSGGEEKSCIGDHWERRLFSSDLMNPIIDENGGTSRISTLTLAYFADSGWYQVDLSRADVAAGWGRGAGCGFVDDTCIGKDGEVPPQNAPFFCNEIPTTISSAAGEIHGCTPDLSRKAVCSIGQYDLDLPSEYQYFLETYGSDVGGADPFMDYCPVYSGFSNGLCSSSDNIDLLKASPIERFGERNSRCLLGNIAQHKTALCLPIACVVEDRSLRVKVDGVWKLCESRDQELKVGGDMGHIVLCPDPRRVCPTFYCPYDCLGTGGACDYSSGNCLCRVQTGYGEKLQVCGENGTDALDIIFNGPFIRPAYEEENDRPPPEMPHPESPLSDYYVPTTESLFDDKSPRLHSWAFFFACVSGLLIFVVSVLLLHDRSKHRHHQLPGWLRCETHSEDGNVVVNPEKDKMIATLLVDIRIQNNDGLSGNGTLVALASVAETDCQLTMSEVSGGCAQSESLSDISSRPPSESLSDADSRYDDRVDPKHLCDTPRPSVIRRRGNND